MTSNLRRLQIYDTTLRDGCQMHNISLSVNDKLRIVRLLDQLQIDRIEGGWPGANPKDLEFFRQVSSLKLEHSKIVSFGSTKRIDSENCSKDPIIQGLLSVDTPCVTLVGKAWDLHVEIALKTSLKKNLEIIKESLRFFKSLNKEITLDAEHFFDGFKKNPNYAKEIIKNALQAGADYICLCDTNGGSTLEEIDQITQKVVNFFPEANFGIHTHNDSGLAVANSLIAVKNGIKQIQGTVNGYGERCGNANLITLICNLELKLNKKTLQEKEKLKKITYISKKISEIANLNHDVHAPFVGQRAFSHKAGIHVSAKQKSSLTYEHIQPELVGNESRITVSEQSGLSNIFAFAENRNLKLDKKIAQKILKNIKEKEFLGYQFEQASASLELLFLRNLGQEIRYFEVIDFRVLSTMDSLSEATVQVKMGEKILHSVSLGVGPGHALDQALRINLVDYYQDLELFRLTDFKVRVIESQDGTAGKTRVNVETESKKLNRKWNTVGVSENIIQATFEAISDSIQFGLVQSGTEPKY